MLPGNPQVPKSLNALECIAAGRALAQLRNEGVLLVGSGEVVHNVPLMEKQKPTKEWCFRFEAWVESSCGVITGGPTTREEIDTGVCRPRMHR